MPTDPALLSALASRGVVVHAPAATLLEDIDPERFEAGAEIYPGTTVRGPRTAVGAGARLGRAGGGWFEDTVVGRGADLYGGVFTDAVVLDGVTVRGHAEVRGGTLIEEGGELAHHVGYKMTITLPFVVAGSVINFCDALFAGGTSRSDHGEIGSCLAHYNYTPWGDKFASLFGDVPHGVFLRSPRVFVGGQTQVVAPVCVGFGTTIAAGCALRRNVGDGLLVGDAIPSIAADTRLDTRRYGDLSTKLLNTARFVGNLQALRAWYRAVRWPLASDAFERLLWAEAEKQVAAGVAERIKRVGKLVKKLPASIAVIEAGIAEGSIAAERGARRIAHQRAIVDGWSACRDAWGAERAVELSRLVDALGRLRATGASYVDAVRDPTIDTHVNGSVAELQSVVAACVEPMRSLLGAAD